MDGFIPDQIQAQSQNTPSELSSFGSGVANAMTLGAWPYIKPYLEAGATQMGQAEVGAPISNSPTAQKLENAATIARYQQELAKTTNPGSYMLGQLGGSALTVPVLGSESLSATALKGAGAGAASGYLNSSPDATPAESLINAAVGGAIGSGIPLTLGGVGQLAGKTIGGVGQMAANYFGRQKLANVLQQAADNPNIQARILNDMQASGSFTKTDPQTVLSQWFGAGTTQPPISLGRDLIYPADPRYANLAQKFGIPPAQAPGTVSTIIKKLKDPNLSNEDLKSTLSDSTVNPYGMLHRTINQTILNPIPAAIQGATSSIVNFAKNPIADIADVLAGVYGHSVAGMGGAVVGLATPFVASAAKGAAGSYLGGRLAHAYSDTVASNLGSTLSPTIADALKYYGGNLGTAAAVGTVPNVVNMMNPDQSGFIPDSGQ